MKKFMFTLSEIDSHKSDNKYWGKFVRQREADITFSIYPDVRFKLALELGAGDGQQSEWISQFCEKLICTDIDTKSPFLTKKISNVDYRIMDAQDLSDFGDCMFDLVFSSNVLEHIKDINKCLRECRRILKPDGLMFHIMPTPWWKVFYFGISLVKFQTPVIHGVSKTHWEEFISFRLKAWKERFTRNNLKILDIFGLPFYIGHGPTFIPIIKAGNLLGIPASNLYIIKKN